MPRRKIRAHYEHMSEFETGRAIGLKEAGWSNRLIARHLCRSNAAIRRCWQKWVNNGSMQRQDGSGRPRATTEREDRAIVRTAVAAPESTLTTIQRVTGTQVSKMTINRRLRERNLRARRPLRCLHLTPCNDNDESRLLLCPDDRHKRVWRRPGQTVDPGLTVEHHTGPQQGVMVWGTISFDSRTPLVVIPGTLTAQRYVDDILRPVLLPFLSHHPGLTFQQDNARPHTARVTMDCLQSCRTLPWPARSTDLSPIEHIWDVMGRRLQPSRNVDYLPRQLETIWQEIPQHTIRNLYQSMTRRVAACIQASDARRPPAPHQGWRQGCPAPCRQSAAVRAVHSQSALPEGPTSAELSPHNSTFGTNRGALKSPIYFLCPPLNWASASSGLEHWTSLSWTPDLILDFGKKFELSYSSFKVELGYIFQYKPTLLTCLRQELWFQLCVLGEKQYTHIHKALLKLPVLYRFTTGRNNRWSSFTPGSAAPNNSLQVRRMSSGHTFLRAYVKVSVSLNRLAWNQSRSSLRFPRPNGPQHSAIRKTV
ncbi:hypothetical protein LAZ67_22000050 [Cordylochernes scorpioides]|uniref:Transposase n=1 Tax=Cordylochernes scorpioides TaxID=51811 RepID=A0ABY6LMZ4_9ARAC|nr:hypothetical protein LAZ67_22000050 [Cordylochernes scorpioides]